MSDPSAAWWVRAVASSAAICALGLGACDRGEPTYYVDGARPPPGAHSGKEPQPEGCVPWSADRPDVLICEPVPEGWEPPPPPGTYADYSEVCDAAALVVESQGSALMTSYGLSAVPKIDLETCGAGGMQEGRWLVRFGLSNRHDVRPYKSAELWNFNPGSDGSDTIRVRLSEGPWPST